jgi:hypothetical protein
MVYVEVNVATGTNTLLRLFAVDDGNISGAVENLDDWVALGVDIAL